MLDPIARTVATMMKRFGGEAKLVVHGEPVYDPETSTVVASETIYTVSAMTFDYIKKSDGDITQGNALIRTGDKQVFVEPLTGMPKPRPQVDKLELAGKRYSVIAVKDTNPSGTTSLLYELYVRE